jgi:SAM-dependent methyltransferase
MTDPFSEFAELYEITHRDKSDDLDLYRGLARTEGGPILELGCGTGRVAIVLAREGHAVTGVDCSRPMLAIGRRKLRREPAPVRARVELVKQDIRTLDLPRGDFPLGLMPYAEFAHLLDRQGQLDALRRVRAHLKKNGCLVISMSNWDPREPRIAFDPARPADAVRLLPLTDEGVFRDPERGWVVTRRMARGYDPSVQTAVHLYVHEIADMEGRPIAKREIALPIRYLFRYEMEMLLEQAGFRVEALYGFYDKSPFRFDSKRMIFVTRRA